MFDPCAAIAAATSARRPARSAHSTVSQVTTLLEPPEEEAGREREPPEAGGWASGSGWRASRSFVAGAHWSAAAGEEAPYRS